jgi:hypothetical protein
MAASNSPPRWPSVALGIQGFLTLPERIKVAVRDGWAFLEGMVDWDDPRSIAESVAHRVQGVKGITNRLSLQPRSYAVGHRKLPPPGTIWMFSMREPRNFDGARTIGPAVARLAEAERAMTARSPVFGDRDPIICVGLPLKGGSKG